MNAFCFCALESSLCFLLSGTWFGELLGGVNLGYYYGDGARREVIS